MENTDIRSTAAILNAKVNSMCNSNSTEDVVANFVEAKDLLIALYKANIEKLSK